MLYPFYLRIIKYVKIPEINLSLSWYFPRVWQCIDQIISTNAKISSQNHYVTVNTWRLLSMGPANTLNCRLIPALLVSTRFHVHKIHSISVYLRP